MFTFSCVSVILSHSTDAGPVVIVMNIAPWESLARRSYFKSSLIGYIALQSVVVVVNRLPFLKFCSNEMDKLVIRLGGSKPSERQKKNERHKSKSQRDKNYDFKRRRVFQESCFSDFDWLKKDANLDIVYCHICRKFPQFADMTLAMFISTSTYSVLRKDNHEAHQLSSKHVS